MDFCSFNPIMEMPQMDIALFRILNARSLEAIYKGGLETKWVETINKGCENVKHCIPKLLN